MFKVGLLASDHTSPMQTKSRPNFGGELSSKSIYSWVRFRNTRIAWVFSYIWIPKWRQTSTSYRSCSGNNHSVRVFRKYGIYSRVPLWKHSLQGFSVVFANRKSPSWIPWWRRTTISGILLSVPFRKYPNFVDFLLFLQIGSRHLGFRKGVKDPFPPFIGLVPNIPIMHEFSAIFTNRKSAYWIPKYGTEQFPVHIY